MRIEAPFREWLVSSYLFAFLLISEIWISHFIKDLFVLTKVLDNWLLIITQCCDEQNLYKMWRWKDWHKLSVDLCPSTMDLGVTCCWSWGRIEHCLATLTAVLKLSPVHIIVKKPAMVLLKDLHQWWKRGKRKTGLVSTYGSLRVWVRVRVR